MNETNDILELKLENERLQDIVNKLPQTADGVAVIPFIDSIYMLHGGIVEVCRVVGFEDNVGFIARTYRWDLNRNIPVHHCYSTRDAAIKASAYKREAQ